MIILVTVALALAGGTTWLALTGSVAGDPGRHQQLTRIGLIACLVAAVVAVAAAAVAS